MTINQQHDLKRQNAELFRVRTPHNDNRRGVRTQTLTQRARRRHWRHILDQWTAERGGS